MPEEQKRAAALSAVIDVKLLSKTAEKEGLQDDAAFKQRLAYLTERELHNAFFKKHVVDAITKEEVKARYDKEIAAVPVQEEIKARHILVKTEEEAKEIIKELDAGKSFVELAKAKSSDPNKDDGGDLGYFTKGRMVPEFDAVAFTLEKGAYTKTPVKTQFGFHVILVEDKRPQAPPALEQVEPQVRQLVMRDKYVELLDCCQEGRRCRDFRSGSEEGLRRGQQGAGSQVISTGGLCFRQGSADLRFLSMPDGPKAARAFVATPP